MHVSVWEKKTKKNVACKHAKGLIRSQPVSSEPQCSIQEQDHALLYDILIESSPDNLNLRNRYYR